MAGRKKAKKELTQEEWLEQALVPEAEWPYRIPGNWCWVRFGEIIELISGRDVALSECNDKGLGIPYILGASNINNDTFIVERWIESPQIVSQKNDILLSVKGTIGRLYVQKENSINISRQIMAIRPFKNLNVTFVYYFLRLICNELREAGNGLIPGISRSDILKKSFALSPSAEQQRIVKRIESVFSKLYEAKEKVQAVIDSFELRKSAILHKAFTGELTKQWRREHGVVRDSWINFSFDECIEKMQNGLTKRKGTEGKECIVLRLANLLDDNFDTTDLRKIMLNEKERQTYSLYKNDVLMIRVNGSKENVGKQLLVTEDNNWTFCDHIIRIRYKKNLVLPQYMVYFSKDKGYRFYIKENIVSSAGQNTISRKGMSGLKVPLPTLSEQQEIVYLLNNFLANEKKTKQIAEAVLIRIDVIKKAILARAFRGELGTNDPAEESAITLLRKMWKESTQNF